MKRYPSMSEIILLKLVKYNMIIDAHTHLGQLGKKSSYFGSTPSSFLGDFMIDMMNKHGIDKIVTFAIGNIRTSNSEHNSIIIEEVKKYPDRIIPFIRLNPYFGEEAVKELEYGVKELGFKGLKLHPVGESYPAHDEIVFPLIEKSINLKIPVIIHSHTRNQSQPALIGLLADHFPDATIIMAHLGCTQYLDAMFVLKHCPNVYADTSCQPWLHRILKKVIDIAGVERIFYGSDSPLHPMETEMRKVELAGLNEEEMRLVMGENIANLLNLKT